MSHLLSGLGIVAALLVSPALSAPPAVQGWTAPKAWGKVTQSVQVGAQMEQTHFLNNKCVCMSALLRVVKFRPALPIQTGYDSPMLGGFKFIVRDTHGKLLPLRPQFLASLAQERAKLKSKTELLEGEMSSTASLSDMYRLAPGRYSVIVKRKVPKQSGAGEVEAVSSPAYFTIS